VIILKRHDHLLIVITVIVSFLFVLLSVSRSKCKTLTNRDVERLKGRYEKKTPSWKPPPNIPPPAKGSTKGAIVIKKYLPYKKWQQEYREYFQRHYNDPNLTLNPKLIVLHYSGTPDFATLWWTFVKGGEYDAGGGKKKTGHLSTHFVIDKDGTLYQLMPLTRRARGTYGVNHAAISIEIIGRNEKDILANKKQMKVVFSLVRWLMNKYKIPASGVRAHTEIARGKELVPQYKDAFYPNKYPPGSRPRGPGKSYMFKLRYYLYEPR